MSKNNLKMKDYIHSYKIRTLFSSFGQKTCGKKVVNICPFLIFFIGSFFAFLYNSEQDFFLIFWIKINGKNESVLLISHNGINELLKGANSCTYIF